VPGSARNWIAVNAVQQSSLNKKMKTKNMTTLHLRNSISRSPLRLGVLLITLLFTCFGLSPTVRALTEGDLGKGNTVEGAGALQSLTTGIHNTALGYQTLFTDTGGTQNTATGSQALKNNNNDNNTADGFQALLKNTDGSNNTATGWRALFQNIVGFNNTANGSRALYNNTATGNTAIGFDALFSNTTGADNTAIGDDALGSNTIGNTNTAVGSGALGLNTGGGNTALGFESGVLLTTGNFNIDIGNEGVAGDSGTIRIGATSLQTATYIAGISGATASGGVAVYVNTDGKLGTLTSSARFKDQIKPMDKASEAILALKPVTFRYKKEIDRNGIPQFGLVAEDVEKINPDLVARDAKGEVYTVRYEAVNAMLLNEFLKEHRTVQELKSMAGKQDAIIARQQKQIDALATGLQKVSDQLELNKPAPRTVLNNQ